MCIKKKSGIYCYSLKIIKWWVLIESNLFLLLHTWPSQTNAQIDRKNSLSYLQFLWHPFLNHLWSLNLTYFYFYTLGPHRQMDKLTEKTPPAIYNFYYIHFKINCDPCNLIGSHQCVLFTNRTIFSLSRIFFPANEKALLKQNNQSDFKACLK